ncbi:hypothetical protein Mycsm_06047 [Mycobacterium sp. JS623]|nr:hypothetical protein Mycsm_06047 [Mycobacterium sp. JS623]
MGDRRTQKQRVVATASTRSRLILTAAGAATVLTGFEVLRVAGDNQT